MKTHKITTYVKNENKEYEVSGIDTRFPDEIIQTINAALLEKFGSLIDGKNNSETGFVVTPMVYDPETLDVKWGFIERLESGQLKKTQFNIRTEIIKNEKNY